MRKCVVFANFYQTLAQNTSYLVVFLQKLDNHMVGLQRKLLFEELKRALRLQNA